MRHVWRFGKAVISVLGIAIVQWIVDRYLDAQVKAGHDVGWLAHAIAPWVPSSIIAISAALGLIYVLWPTVRKWFPSKHPTFGTTHADRKAVVASDSSPKTLREEALFLVRDIRAMLASFSDDVLQDFQGQRDFGPYYKRLRAIKQRMVRHVGMGRIEWPLQNPMIPTNRQGFERIATTLEREATLIPPDVPADPPAIAPASPSQTRADEILERLPDTPDLRQRAVNLAAAIREAIRVYHGSLAADAFLDEEIRSAFLPPTIELSELLEARLGHRIERPGFFTVKTAQAMAHSIDLAAAELR
jgi:hypothetical protein